MNKLFLVGMGGFAGAILRYALSGLVQNLSHSIAFPYGTLVVNMTGCFLMGICYHLVEIQVGMTAEMRLLLMVGLLGSFTTYSTFSGETLQLLQDQRVFAALMNMGIHIVVGLSAVWLGRLAIITIRG
jgi:CrcB protein